MSNQDLDTTPGVGDYKLIVYRLDLLEKGQEALKEGQEKLEDRLDQILAALRNINSCPDPTRCGLLGREIETLKTENEELKKRVRSIEDARTTAAAIFSTSKVWLYLLYTLLGSGFIKLLFDVYTSATKK